MAFSVGELVVALTAGTATFNRGIDAASDRLRQFVSDEEKQASALGSIFKTLAVSVGLVAGAGAAIFASVNAAVQSVGALNDEVAQLGVSAEEFQRLSFAAKDFGVDAAGLQASLRIFTRNVGNAINASADAQTVFKQLGIALQGVGGRAKTNRELIGEFADALASKVPNAQQRAAFAVEAFGQAGARLVPLLSQGSSGLKEFGDEAERLGFVLSNSTVANADAAAEAFDRLTGAFGVQLKGALVELAPALLDIAADIFPRLITVTQLTVDAFNGLKVLFVGLGGVVVGLGRAFVTLLDTLFDLARFTASGLKSLVLLLKGDLVGASRAAEEAQGTLLSSLGDRITELKDNFADASGAISVALDDVTKSTTQADGVFAKLNATFEALGATARKTAEDIRSGAVAAKAVQNSGQTGDAGAILPTTTTEALAALKKAEQDREDRLAAQRGPLIEQALQLERQVEALRKLQLSAADRARADVLVKDLLQQQADLLKRQEAASEGLADRLRDLRSRINDLARIDPAAATEFTRRLEEEFSAAIGPEAQSEVLARTADELQRQVDQRQPQIAAAVGSGVGEGIQSALAGGNGLQVFAGKLQAVGQTALTNAFTEAGNSLGTLLEKVLPAAAGKLGSVLTVIFGAVLGSVFNKTEVQSAAGNIQSAVTNAQQVRGVIAGPTSLGIAQVGVSIREAFRESERLLGVIARNTTVLATARRSGATSASGAEGPAFALANESAALV